MKRKLHPVISDLRDVRIRSNISQNDLAEKIGVTHGCISHWERGFKTPTWFNFVCWADSLGVEIEIKEKHDGV